MEGRRQRCKARDVITSDLPVEVGALGLEQLRDARLHRQVRVALAQKLNAVQAIKMQEGPLGQDSAMDASAGITAFQQIVLLQACYGCSQCIT